MVLVDHFASDTINAGVAARSGFVQSFEGEAVDELDGLRADFVRKAVLAGTDRVCRPLLASRRHDGRARRRSPWGRCPPRRTASGFAAGGPSSACPAGDDAPLLVDATTGEAVGAEVLPMHLARTRLTRVSVEANSGVCRGLLRERYPAAVGQGQTQERP